MNGRGLQEIAVPPMATRLRGRCHFGVGIDDDGEEDVDHNEALEDQEGVLEHDAGEGVYLPHRHEGLGLADGNAEESH